ncbi:hypothetical protein ALNOE001_18530 [Candidatus Methanobinarius endosymbioticus]|uniref:Uncharacterized protein n=1 Tax=Candidatus Methanobinarius endosymbioticus TaxID=2006182 RepID=A0A366MAS3_9EURY|nr:hypothetical protein ALNOE001_18530 [Candidatus Methanobinarius endosymbioticus]
MSFWVYGKIVNNDNDEIINAETEETLSDDKISADGSSNYSHDDIINRANHIDEEDNVDIYSSSDIESKSGMGTSFKLGVGLILVVILVLAGLFFVGLFVSDDVSNPNVFNDSNISFSYPNSWVCGNDSDLSLVLEDDNVVTNINISDSEGESINQLATDLLSTANKSGVKLLYKNSLNVNGFNAYEIEFDFDKNGGFQLRILLFIANDKVLYLCI